MDSHVEAIQLHATLHSSATFEANPVQQIGGTEQDS